VGDVESSFYMETEEEIHDRMWWREIIENPKEFEAKKLLNFQFETNQSLSKQSTNILLNFHFQNKLLAPPSQTLHIPA
jgi:hypothetical protein